MYVYTCICVCKIRDPTNNSDVFISLRYKIRRFKRILHVVKVSFYAFSIEPRVRVVSPFRQTILDQVRGSFIGRTDMVRDLVLYAFIRPFRVKFYGIVEGL